MGRFGRCWDCGWGGRPGDEDEFDEEEEEDVEEKEKRLELVDGNIGRIR